MPLINHAVLRRLMAEFDALNSAPSTEPRRQERLDDVQYTLCVYTGIHDPRQAVAWARRLLGTARPA
jgi:hypothetical protein